MSTAPYLGKPGAMRALPLPRDVVTVDESRGDIEHDLLSGGVAVTSLLHPKKKYGLQYPALKPAEAATLRGFYLRQFGLGPFVFVDPSAPNALGFDVSTCGIRTQAPPGWINSSGTLTVDATTAAPTGAPDSGVLKLAGAAASATLQPGLVVNTANTAAAPVYLPGEPVTVALWIKASAAASLTLQLCGYTSAGVVSVTSVSTAVSATTSWQQFTVTAAAGNAALAAVAFVLPRVVLGASAPANLWIAGAHLGYASTAPAWLAGFGSPRVLPVAPPGRVVQTLGVTDHTFTLREV